MLKICEKNKSEPWLCGQRKSEIKMQDLKIIDISKCSTSGLLGIFADSILELKIRKIKTKEIKTLQGRITLNINIPVDLVYKQIISQISKLN